MRDGERPRVARDGPGRWHPPLGASGRAAHEATAARLERVGEVGIAQPRLMVIGEPGCEGVPVRPVFTARPYVISVNSLQLPGTPFS